MNLKMNYNNKILIKINNLTMNNNNNFQIKV
jgi:hypothetical protein